MSEYEENIEEFFKDESEPPYCGEYLGERNSLGERHGKGWAILPNGDQYDGSYRKGKRHGRGLYVFKNGARYLGNYRCGIKSGYGKFIYPDGTIYEGNWHKNQKHGEGTYTYANGDCYSGSWYKGRRHGVGIYRWRDLSVYFEGTWKNGIRVGPCLVHYPKFIFHGCWDYQYPQGPGVFSFDEKHILHGYYRSDTLFKSDLQICERDLENSRKYIEYSNDEEEKLSYGEEGEEANEIDSKPPTWISQNMCMYHYSLLPQHPIPLPIEDSELSLCDLDSIEAVSSNLEEKSIEPSFQQQEFEEAKEEMLFMEDETESESECGFNNNELNPS